MTKQDFIFTLFDNGQGLTLDQIERVEAYCEDDAACMTFDDYEIQDLIPAARDVYWNRMHDCTNMLELRDYLNKTIYADDEKSLLTDMQVYHLWYVTKEN